ncbi:MAG: HepT-like ribonuclease domain-containing protein, partial [Ornithinimicrobium sp.]
TARSVERYAAERMMIQLVDLATDINAHLASTLLKRAPEEYADGFRLVAQIVPLPEKTARELELAARMRNVLVHQYVDLDPDRFAAALPRVRPVFRIYIEVVAQWLLTQADA